MIDFFHFLRFQNQRIQIRSKREKKREIFRRNSQIFCLDLSSRAPPPLIFPLMFLASRGEPKAHPFPKLNPSIRGASPIIMPFDFDPKLAFRSRSSSSSSSSPHLLCSTRLQRPSPPPFFQRFQAATTFHFFRPFPRPLPAVLSRSTHPTRPNGNATPPLHRGISIYLLVFKSRLDIQRERYSPFSWIRNFNYEMPRSRSSK